MRVFLFLSVIVLLAVTSFQLWVTRDTPLSGAIVDQAIGQSEVQIGGPFTLVDQHGETVRESEFRGRVMLVFFGFTHCPDICPVTVAALSKAMALLGDKAGQVAPIFITVDPARDTPEVMQAYLEHFDPRFVGLTGTQEQIRQAQAAYKAYAAKAAQEAPAPAPRGHEGHAGHDHGHGGGSADYAMDHSAYIYLMDRQGKYHSIFSYTTPEQELAHAVEQALER